MSLRVLENSGRTSKKELLIALAEELKRVRVRAAELHQKVDQVESKLDSKYETLDAAKALFEEEQELNAQTILQLRREIANARSEIDLAAIVDESEAQYYLSLLHNPARFVPSATPITNSSDDDDTDKNQVGSGSTTAKPTAVLAMGSSSTVKPSIEPPFKPSLSRDRSSSPTRLAAFEDFKKEQSERFQRIIADNEAQWQKDVNPRRHEASEKNLEESRKKEEDTAVDRKGSVFGRLLRMGKPEKRESWQI